MVAGKGKAVALPKVDDEALRSIANVDDAMRIAMELYGVAAVDAADHLGNGFANVQNKDSLLGVPLFIIGTQFHGGNWGEFVTLFAITMDGANSRVMFSDGSTGVYENVKELTGRTGHPGGWIIKSGLRKSEYPTCLGCGRPRGTDVECDTAGCEKGQHSKLGDTYDAKRGEGTTYYFDVA